MKQKLCGRDGRNNKKETGNIKNKIQMKQKKKQIVVVASKRLKKKRRV
jgi:hypothetical protein